MAVQAKINSHTVVAIVDTSSAGIVISKSCFDQLGMVKDEEVEFKITLATDTNKKVRTVLFGVNITVGRRKYKSWPLYWRVCILTCCWGSVNARSKGFYPYNSGGPGRG